MFASVHQYISVVESFMCDYVKMLKSAEGKIFSLPEQLLKQIVNTHWERLNVDVVLKKAVICNTNGFVLVFWNYV